MPRKYALDITKKVALATGNMQKDTKVIVDAVFEAILSELKDGNTVCIRDFFTMSLKKTKERAYKHVKTKEPFVVPSKTKVKVKISEILTENLNK
jgi:nucleoid DNA-binding protein